MRARVSLQLTPPSGRQQPNALKPSPPVPEVPVLGNADGNRHFLDVPGDELRAVGLDRPKCPGSTSATGKATGFCQRDPPR
jgi:hypothetical protein